MPKFNVGDVVFVEEPTPELISDLGWADETMNRFVGNNVVIKAVYPDNHLDDNGRVRNEYTINNDGGRTMWPEELLLLVKSVNDVRPAQPEMPYQLVDEFMVYGLLDNRNIILSSNPKHPEDKKHNKKLVKAIDRIGVYILGEYEWDRRISS